MIRNPDLVRAVEEAATAEWLAKISIEEAFRLADEMDQHVRKLAPDTYRIPDGSSIQKDKHVIEHQRLQAFFKKVVPPEQ